MHDMKRPHSYLAYFSDDGYCRTRHFRLYPYKSHGIFYAVALATIMFNADDSEFIGIVLPLLYAISICVPCYNIMKMENSTQT